MLFPTVDFAIFFAVVFLLSWSLSGQERLRLWILVIASYVFYGMWDWRFTFLLLNCSLVNYVLGRWLESSQKHKRFIVSLAVCLNLLTLAFFKYYGFFISNVNEMLIQFGLERELPFLEIVLPVGISFFTFQGMSYVIDIYRGQLKARKPIVDVLLYISFFPQLVAGPIVRAKDFLVQLDRPIRKSEIPTGRAVKLIAIGLTKKVIIANYLATLLVDDIFNDPTRFGAVDILFGVYGYAVQIYCDFSAYTDIAIGVAALLGYQFNQNFDSPYRANSLQNFWRRWHISLSTWLRDYLYISLGGSRQGPFRTYRNLFLTMFLGGLWHGAAWNFVIWGTLHGFGLIIERLVGSLRQDRKGRAPNGVENACRMLLVFHFVCLTWIFFRAKDLTLALELLSQLGQWTISVAMVTPFTCALIAIGIFGQFVSANFESKLEDIFSKAPIPLQALMLGLFLSLLGSLAPKGVAPFIYFQF